MAEEPNWDCPYCGGPTRVYSTRKSPPKAPEFRTRYRRCNHCRKTHPRHEVVPLARD